MTNKDCEEDERGESYFIERAAALEHERWARWQKYLHSRLRYCEQIVGGKTVAMYVMSADYYERLERQISLDYSELSVNEQESDREQARYYLPLVRRLIADERIRLSAENARDIRCTRCNGTFDEHHWIFSHRGEHYHSGCLEKSPIKMTQMVEHARIETAKAFGGCTKCYGKGYFTQIENAGGFDDVTYDTVNVAMPYYNPCSCDRGKQIAEMLKSKMV